MRGHLYLIGVVAAALAGCPPATLTEVEREVFAMSCVFSSCHQGSSAQQGLNLEGSTYGKLVGVAAKGPPDRTLIVPRDLGASYLFEKVTVDLPEAGERMPPGTHVSGDQLEMIRSWIKNGAPND